MRRIEVDGKMYEIVETIEYNKKIVKDGDRQRVAVKDHSGRWRFWNAFDRIAPLSGR